MDMLVVERYGVPSREGAGFRTHRSWSWARLGAVCGFVGGSLAAILGPGLSAGAWALGGGVAGSVLSGVGTALSFLTVPLLLLGGHCLDVLDERRRRRARGRPGPPESH